MSPLFQRMVIFFLFLGLRNVAFCANESVDIGVVPNFPASVIVNGYFMSQWSDVSGKSIWVSIGKNTAPPVTVSFSDFVKGVVLNELSTQPDSP